MLLQQQRYTEACTGLERTIVLKKTEFSCMCASDGTTGSSFVYMEKDISALEKALEKLQRAIAARDFSQALEAFDNTFEQIRESDVGDDWDKELEKEAQRLYDHKDVLVERANVLEPLRVNERGRCIPDKFHLPL